MNTQVLEVKNKSRHWMMWAVLAIIVAFLAYTNIDTLKPAARKAYDKLSVAVSSFEPAKSASTAYDKLSAAVSSVVPAESANTTDYKPGAAASSVVLPESASTGTFAFNAAPAVTIDTARRAFTQGDLPGSLNAYWEYIARNPGDIDARGELGNVYLLSGNVREAAQTYYELSKMLIDQNQPDLVPDLLPVIAMVNPDQADELMDMLFRFQQQFYENQPAQAPGQG
jgi:hypothetical protein